MPPDCQREAIAAAFYLLATYLPYLSLTIFVLTITYSTPSSSPP